MITEVLRLRTFVATILCFGFIHTAMAAPQAGVITGTTTETFSGTQNLGVSPDNGNILTINVQGLNDTIAPSAGTNGITLTNSGGNNVTINSGTTGPVVVITTTGGASGILIKSTGTPPDPSSTDPLLNVYIPTGTSVQGGVVTVNSISNISTSGGNGYGISAASATSGYSPKVINSLNTFNGSGITFKVTAVDGSGANVGQPAGVVLVDGTGTVVGSTNDEVTLDANGSFSFTAGSGTGSAYGNLTVGGTMYVQVTDTLSGSNSLNSGTAVITGTTVLQVVKTGGGAVVTPFGSDFSSYGSQSGTTTIFPDATSLTAYVNSLKSIASAGGNGNSVTVTSSGSIQTTGLTAHGIFATSQGGNGANGSDATISDSSTDGTPGSIGGTVTVNANGSISTGSDNAAGVLAWSLGGNGGNGGDSGYTRNAKDGSDGGNGGNANVFGNGTIVTTGSASSGIIALSQGGNGGQGGQGSTFNDGSDGGKGGAGGSVDVSGTWNITTSGVQAHGIWARSVGGIAGGGGSGGWAGSSGGGGGQGTNGGDVTVVSSGSISTSGSSAYGIYAESVGGFGGNGGSADSVFYSSGGSGASAGSGGNVSVTNNGSITTTGSFGNGIFAQSVGGGGGSGGGNSIGSIAGLGGSGNSGGNGGSATITNTGTISATGFGARGIYAQSIGGGGGDGANLIGIVPIGGDGSKTSSGSSASVYNTGKVTAASNAIFVQSVGGGGGNGGSASGWFSVGGAGGAGGDGGAVAVASNGDLSTTEANASAIFAQSLGGGGGNGGNSVAVGAFGSLAIGGKGGVGGIGSTVIVGINSGSAIDPVTGTITTIGSNSDGIQAQSVGGGGGNGGYATSASVGSGLSISVAIGGGGGKGSDSSEVDVYFGNANSSISTSGTNANGIFAQSVGGGGGSGGFSIAATGGSGFNASVSVGGTGGSGGNGGTVQVGGSNNETSGTIATTGDHSYGILAQSVGGGGGNGGYSIAADVSVGGVGGALSFGGSGGTAGTGSTVNLYSSSIVSTQGNNSTAIFAQSVGGGGGSGGYSIGAGISTGAALDLSFGGSGGGGGNGGAVTLHSDGSMVTTAGNNSDGILAQSVGGGGGNGGFSVAGSLSGGPAVNLSMGGDGGTASSGSSVTVVSSSIIGTGGNNSAGIFAQSVGGGGGSGGFSIAAGISANPVSGGLGSNVSVGLGGDGGAGGSAGNVSVTSTGSMIMTGTGFASGNYGNNSDGILAQSVGGGGGAGGFSIAGGIASGASVNFSMAGSGSSGGNAGTVNLTSSSVVITHGTDSSAIFGQSVGGGGGQGGFSVAGGISGESASINASIGGGGGGGGTASTVTVISTGSLVMTGTGSAFDASSNHSSGIVAQSIGGSGGDGGFSVAGGISISGPTLNFSLGGAGGTGQDSGAVQLLSTSRVITHGNDSTAVFAQSLGGGGGSGGFSVSGAISGASVAIDASIGGKGAGGGSAGNVAVGATITGTNGATGLPTYSGSAVTGGITTYGDHSYGILAQSLGGGGGNGGFSVAGGISDSASVNFSMGGSGGNAGAAGDVVLDSVSSVETSGTDSHAIFAQSVGGGGGSGGFSVTGGFSASSAALGASIGGSGSSGGAAATVTLISSGSTVITNGDHSYGLLAQSVGGGGGDGGFSIAADASANSQSGALSFSMGGAGGNGGAGSIVFVNNSSSIQTSGDDSFGIFAQSLGGGGGSGAFSIAGSITSGKSANVSLGGTAGGGGNANNVTLIDTGSAIITGGDRSSAILAQSLGGGGGAGGFSVAGGVSGSTSLNFSMGGGGGLGGNGGVVSVSSSSAIMTTGTDSNGILAQSVGGGGGDGGFSVTGAITTGSSTSVGASIGGSGTAGGFGNTVSVTNTGSSIDTFGDHSDGILAQSVGGGGGNGGFSVAGGISGGNSVNFSIGGSGGGAGYGSAVSVINSSAITTTGQVSDGIFAQSIGGGGGSGGFSVAGSISSKAGGLTFSLGGSGGSGGAGGTVYVANTGNIMTGGTDSTGKGSDGILAQSIGGGGGAGGFSGALSGGFGSGKALAVTVGGSGAGGGDSSAVSVTSKGNVITTGMGSTGIFAQSVGGGGGDGGFSLAVAATSGTQKATTLSVAIGGSGGAGGKGNVVVVGGTYDSTSSTVAVDPITGMIMTTGSDSDGILAQSIGGGGGNGGFSAAGTLNTGTSTGSKQMDVSVGGDGGGANDGALVSVNTNATSIITLGDASIGILAQSIGGGGGNGGMAFSGAFAKSPGTNLSLTLGGTGAVGGNGGEVDVTSNNPIFTTGDDSHGILAQSIGGGGGNGGLAGSVDVGVSGSMNVTTVNLGVTIGGAGGLAGNGGNVAVNASGGIATQGDESHGIFAQSIGGGGGAGGGSIAGTVSLQSSSPGTVYNVSVAVGGQGGAGGTSGDVVVNNNGDISTMGGGSHGIFAQSIGGGGGSGGSARAITLAIPGGGQMDQSGSAIDGTKQNKELSLSIGGNGGTGNDAGTVTVSNTGTIVTMAGDAYGILAQSIGGGGGNGGNADLGLPDGLSAPNKVGFFKNISVIVGGSGAGSGKGDTVAVTQTGNISTGGEGSYGIFAQSVGGGGGIGGASDIGSTGKIGIGGGGGASGDGGNVTVTVLESGTTMNTIITAGDGADAIFAQSVGGGGGVAGNVNRGLLSYGGFGAGVAVGNPGGAGGDGGTVTISSTTNIITSGSSANGIFAQSVGGGGGLAGNLGNDLPVLDLLNFAGSVGGAGSSGTVNVTQTGNIVTTGNLSDGIIAQSAAGTGTGGPVTVDFTGIMSTSGTYSTGILGQSTGQGGAHDIMVTVTGTLIGGSGTGAATVGPWGIGYLIAATGTDPGAALGFASGVHLVGGSNNTITNNGLITTADGIAGWAIVGEGGNETVDNNGNITGSIDLENGTTSYNNTFNHNAGALLQSGAVIYLGTGNTFNNSGTISPGAVGTLQTTALTGNFTQTGSASWFFDITPAFTSDLFAISGTANLSSYVNTVNLNELAVPNTTGTYTLVTASKGLTGNFLFGTMSGTTMPIGLTYTLSNSDTQEQLILSVSTGPFYWRGAVDNTWNDDFTSGSENWTSDVTGTNYIYGTPGVADDVYFSTTNAINQNTTLGADFIINSLIISDTTPVTIGGSNTLTLAAASGAGITVNPGTAPSTISANVALGGDQSWTNNSSNLLDISGSSITSPGNHNLIVEGSGNTLISAIIATGAGSLTKDGAGTLVLYGAPNTYSGGTTLKNGTLLAANANALGTGNVNLTGGILRTSHDPANPAKTPLSLHVGGSYTQSAPSILILRIIGPTGPTGVSDGIVVAGIANLGGTLMPDYSLTGYNPVPPAGNYTDAFDVLHSNVGLSGTFNAYVDPHYNPNKLLRWEPYYEPKDVMLEWVQYPFSGLNNLTFNQTSVANALDLELGLHVPPVPLPYNQSTGPALNAHPGLGALIYFLNNDSLANLPYDYDLIAPEELTSIFDISRSFADVQSSNIEDRLANLRGGSAPGTGDTTVGLLVSDGKDSVGLRDDDKNAAPPAAPDAPRSDLFIEGNGDFVRVNSDSNAAGYNFTTGGVTVGGDYRVSNHFIIGLMGGYANTGATLTQNGSVDVDSGRLGAYSTLYGGGFYLNSLAAGGYNSYDTHRSALGGIAQGNTNGSEFDAMIGGGYDLHTGHFTLGPVVSAQYTYVGIDGYTEMGSLAPLHIDTQNQDSLLTKAGFKISSEWNVRGVIITPSLTASWEHEFLDSTFALDSAFASGSGNIFTVKGPAIGRNGVGVNAGVNVQWTPRFGTYIYYNGELGRKNYQVNSVTGGVRLSY